MKLFIVSRIHWFIAAMLTMISGLLWRSRFLDLSPFLKKYGGDALWAAMVFFLIGLLCPGWNKARLTLASLIFSWGIEFTQLYHAPWIDGIRANRLGALVLGSTYSTPDLAAYVVGVLIGWAVCIAWMKPTHLPTTPRI
jgi:Protein of unknown function (DUF2809)